MVIAPRVRRVRAPNASAMTLDGTNTYLLDLGAGAALVIDPGPAIESHVEAIVHEARSAGLAIAAIAVTHSHPDHFPAAAPLAAMTSAPVYAHRDARFAHERTLGDRETIALGERVVTAIESPGHARDHLVFATDDDGALFTGDVVVGRGTVIIAPPGGEMRAYQRTLAALRDRDPAARRLYGGHGEPVDDPHGKFEEYLAHRVAREEAIVAELHDGPKTIPELVTVIYRDVARLLWPAAARQVDAYLIAFEAEGRVERVEIDRSPTALEREILSPDFSALVAPADADVVRAELGLDVAFERVARYSLV